MGRLRGLDALRGTAALCVLGYHVNMVFGGFEIFSRSYLAVDFFFMLSGFVMARTYEPSFPKLTARRFVLKRYVRLWPPMAIGAALGFLSLLPLQDWTSAASIFATTLLMVPHPFLRPFLTNSPAWSIFFELFANAVHGALLWKVRTRFLLFAAAGSLVVLAFICGWRLSVGHNAETFFGGFPRVMLPYCLGIALCRWGAVSRFPAWPAFPILAGLLLFLPHGLGFDLAFVALACPLVILIGSGRGAFGEYLGKLSFPLYAVHVPILHLTEQGGYGPWLGIGLALSCAMAITAVFEPRHRLVTQPA